MSDLLLDFIEPFAKLAHDNDIKSCVKNCGVTSLSANCDKSNGETDNKVCNGDCGARGAAARQSELLLCITQWPSKGSLFIYYAMLCYMFAIVTALNKTGLYQHPTSQLTLT